jgi:hypothetical protein
VFNTLYTRGFCSEQVEESEGDDLTSGHIQEISNDAGLAEGQGTRYLVILSLFTKANISKINTYLFVFTI